MDKKEFSIGKAKLIIYGNSETSPEAIEKSMNLREKELFRIVRDCSVKEYRALIEHKNDYFYLSNLSHFRKNIVRWLPIRQGDKVLEIGAKAGAVSVGLLELSENITLLEQNLTLARILAERFENCKESIVISGAINDCVEGLKEEKSEFDWIIVYNPEYLEKAVSLISDNGHIILICDNRLGLKFFAGNKSEEAKDYFTYIEGKNIGETVSYSMLDLLKTRMNCKDMSVYYPYPDYRFTKNLYSDRHLPTPGELVDNLNNYESDRMVLFSEKEAFDASCRDGSFKYIANSYLVVFGEPLETEYVRFSNDRVEERSIYTSIVFKNGCKQVKKHPFCSEAEAHINEIYENYGKLVKRYEGSPLKINTCNLFESEGIKYVSFGFIEGRTLEEMMDDCIRNGDMDGFYKLFDRYVKYLSFDSTGEITDIDAVFSNILISNDDEWTLIDYEWCKQSKVEIRETAYRAVYCYILEDSSRKVIDLDLIRKKLVLSKAASDEIEADEMKFQKMITGKLKALGELREALGHKAVNPIPYAARINDGNSGLTVQVYPADAQGNFSEETSYVVDGAYVSEHEADILIPIEKNSVRLRIDPMNNCGIVTVEECRINELDYPFDNKKYLTSNGKRLSDASFAFATEDPNLVFGLNGLVREDDSFFFLKLRIDILPKAVCDSLCVKLGILGRFS